ncbi:MAG: hypothetical protein QHH80_13790 [Anaerolineae bacterium]|nr:hypothetical protein [Anaerolineae bacterium]
MGESEDTVAGKISIRRGNLGDVGADEVSLVQCAAHNVSGQDVRMVQCSAQSVRAENLSGTITAALEQDAATANLRFCSIGMLDADKADVNIGNIYAVLGHQVSLRTCGARMIVAQDRIEMHQSGAALVAAGEVEASEVRAGVVLAKEVRGNVRALLDTRAAAIFGAAFGAAFAAIWLLRRRK